MNRARAWAGCGAPAGKFQINAHGNAFHINAGIG